MDDAQLRLVVEPLGQPQRDWLVHVQQPILREREHGHSRHVLRDRVDRLHGVGCHRPLARDIGVTPTLREEHAIVLQGYDRDSGNVLTLHVCAHDAIDARRCCRLRSGRNADEQRTESQEQPPHAAMVCPG